MLALNINNPTIENFFKVECQNDNNKFIENLLHYVETYTIKQQWNIPNKTTTVKHTKINNNKTYKRKQQWNIRNKTTEKYTRENNSETYKIKQ